MTLKIRNSGTRAGAEVVELYLHDAHSNVDRPVQELKGFQRVTLAAGETKTVHFTLDKAALSYYSPDTKDWITEPGQFDVLIGASSRDIRAKGSFNLEQ